jgi:hypothetical protein
MSRNFIKEVFWKNDLTYLCITFPLVLFLIKDQSIFLIMPIASIISLLLAFSWYASLKKRYIFNSLMKVSFLVGAILTSFHFIPTENGTMQFIASSMDMVFISFYSTYVFLNSYCLAQNVNEHYEGEYHPELEDTYRENAYRRSIYSIMKWNNTIEYQYDKDIDAYLHYGKLYEKISHLWFGFRIQNAGKDEISWLHDYIAYLHEHGLYSNKMNADELAVFKMYNI